MSLIHAGTHTPARLLRDAPSLARPRHRLGNLTIYDGKLRSEIGYVASAPRDRAVRRELEAELDRIQTFLGVE